MNKIYGIAGILWGGVIAKCLIAKYPGIHMIFTYESIGDQCMELAYAREYQKMNHISTLAVLTTNANHAVFQYFRDAFDFVIQISRIEYQCLLNFYKSDRAEEFRRRYPQIKCVFYTAYVRNLVFSCNPYVRLSELEKAIYHIPRDTSPAGIRQIPCTAWLEQLKKDKLIKMGRTILLNPYANSCRGVPMDFFEIAAVRFKKEGYKVITGLCGPQKAVSGTKGVVFPLEKAVAFADACGFVMGVRSGFMDLISFSCAKVIAIDCEEYPLADACRLEDWWIQNPNIKTFRYKKEEKILDKIIQYIKLGEIKEK